MHLRIRCVPRRICFDTIVFAIAFTNIAVGRSVFGDDLRLNQIQVIGTHNSYHLAPTPATLKLIEAANREAAPKIDYTHRPLEEQFGALGIRQIELDVYADPDGGRYATPMAYRILKAAGEPDPNLDGSLLKPGFKILHVPDIDYRTNVRTLEEALQRIRKWSQDHPTHLPIFVLMELKDEPIKGLTPPIEFSAALLDELDATIRRCFDDNQMITPDQVRKSRDSLQEAVLNDGWPTLDKCLGRVLFAMDNEGKLRDDYLAEHPSLSGRVLFVSGRSDSAPEAAFFKINDPVQDHARIQRLVRQGYLVRTRADADTLQSRNNDTNQREQAFKSGAQFISTDYPQPDERFSEYSVRFPGDRMSRSNPLNSTEAAEIVDVELKK